MATCPRCRTRIPLAPAVALEPSASRPGPVSAHTLGQLFEKGWTLFRARWKVLVGLHLLTYALLFLPTVLGFAAGYLAADAYPELKRNLILLGTLTGLAIGLPAMFWGYAGFMAAVVEPDLDFRAALGRGRQLLGPFLWALSLSGLLVLGAFLLFFIPGLLMMVWFLFIPFILVESPARGMQSLLRSRHLVAGYWWEVFGKFFVISLVPSALSAIPLAGPILGLLAVPYVTLMLYLVYQDQLRRNPPATQTAGGRTTLGWWLMALAGYALLIIPLLLIFSRHVEEAVQGIAL